VYVAALLQTEEEDFVTVVDSSNGRVILREPYHSIVPADARNAIRVYFARKQ